MTAAKTLGKFVGILALTALPAASFAQTHLGVSASAHVTLVGVADPASKACKDNELHLREQKPNGEIMRTDFVVPANQYLILTDFSWTSGGSGPIPNDRLHRLRLITRNPDGSAARVVFLSSGNPVVPGLGRGARVSGQEHLIAGLRVEYPDRVLCGRTQFDGGSDRRNADVPNIRQLRLHGYVVDKN